MLNNVTNFIEECFWESDGPTGLESGRANISENLVCPSDIFPIHLLLNKLSETMSKYDMVSYAETFDLVLLMLDLKDEMSQPALKPAQSSSRLIDDKFVIDHNSRHLDNSINVLKSLLEVAKLGIDKGMC